MRGRGETGEENNPSLLWRDHTQTPEAFFSVKIVTDHLGWVSGFSYIIQVQF